MNNPAKPFSVNLWGSNPEEENDDCWTGDDFATLAEAISAMNNWREHFNRALPSYMTPYGDRDVAYVEIDGPGINGTVKNTKFCSTSPGSRGRDDSDAEWRRECAMQAGMGLGIDAYNDEMGS